MSFSTGVQSVDALEHFNSEGNIIPSTWFQHFKMKDGKPDSIGIFLLSEIVYWHRPTIVRDELTGRIVGMRKKFKSDMLQRSYDSFVEQFGYTKTQIRDALNRLEESGVITRHFRTIDVNGTKLSNVLFIELNAEKVLTLSTLSGLNQTPSQDKTRHPIGFKPDTYTETTNTETTIHSSSNTREEKKPLPAIKFSTYKVEDTKKYSVLELVSEYSTFQIDFIKIAQTRFPDVTQDRFTEMMTNFGDFFASKTSKNTASLWLVKWLSWVQNNKNVQVHNQDPKRGSMSKQKPFSDTKQDNVNRWRRYGEETGQNDTLVTVNSEPKLIGDSHE